MSNYIVKNGETIMDVCVNSTGTYLNLDSILTANSYTDWNPTLIAGQEIIIPDDVQKQSNVLNVLNNYPICNNINTDIVLQITNITKLFANGVLFDDDENIEVLFDNDGNNVNFN